MRNLAFALLILAASVTAAAAENLPISAFYGRFVGEGQASTLQGGFFNVSERDLDVVIEAAGDGVRISWTTFLRKGNDPNNPEIVKRSAQITFKKTDQPNVFIEKRGVDPFDETPVSWARIDGRTLTTYTFLVDKDGVYTVASYARKLAPGGKSMQLQYRAFQDGEWITNARADLVKK